MSNRTAILVERNYKGFYERFALTRSAFAAEYPDSPAPTTDGDTDTLRPLVHIWYKAVLIGGADWDVFFRDMAWGLEHDDGECDTAYVRWDSISPDLVEDVVTTIYHNTPAESPDDCVSLPRDSLHETYDCISKVLTDIEQYDEVNPLMDDAYDALVDAHRLLASAIN